MRYCALLMSILLPVSMAACGKSSNLENELSGHKATDEKPQPSAADAVAAKDGFQCLQEKSPGEYLTTLTQDLFRRGPTAEEQSKYGAGGYDPAALVDWAFTQPDYDTGIAYFVSNLLRLAQNLPVDPNDKNANDVALLSDLRQEPVVLIQKNKNRPWPEIFTTQEVYCTSRTAALYGFPVDPNISGFVQCKLPPERAGLLGLVSTLRAFKSAFYLTNSNRHRVALALYLAQGIQLSAKTDGPVGTGTPAPLEACVPEIDMRVAKSGQIFGTAAVPKVGPVCAGCHVKYLAPMEPAFLRFGEKGELLDLPDVDKLNDADINGIDKETLKDILQFGNRSCWAPGDTTLPPEVYTGLPGLARLIGGSDKLAGALAVQIQQNLVNKSPDQTTSDSIVQSYKAGGETLQSALRGYFLSAPYLCAKRKGGI